VDEIAASDARLLTRARRGEEAAFLDLYQRYRRPVFQFAWRLTGSEATAEDVTQECFLALLDGAAYDPASGALRTYLLGIARHRAMRRLRAADREPAGDSEQEHVSDGPDPLGSLLCAERAELVARAIAALPLAQREAVLLFEYEDLSLEEIAQVTGSEPGAVKSRLFRARESLRRRLAPYLAAPAARSSR
jgi:RNA polymerase sigma-70 factor (ECF subfamily)